MSKKIVAGIGIFVVIIALLAGFYFIYYKPAIQEKKQLIERFSEFESQYQEKKAQGYDVTKAEEFARRAKQAFDKKDYKRSNDFLDNAFEALERARIPVTPTPPVPTPFGWIYEGPIYQTHPYAYPNHSFRDLTQQIPQLADLGVKTIYLMPIWEHPEGRGSIYAIYDYFRIDPEYGTPQELKELVDTAHRYNMKILFDFVTCCTPKRSIVWNNNWTLSISLSELERKAEELGWKLEYTTIDGDKYVYANCRSEGDKQLCDAAGMIIDNKVILRHYRRADWGFAIDRTNPNTIKYFTNVAEYYVREYGIDGWRIDAPSANWNPKLIPEDHSITELMRNVKGAITTVKPDAILLSETQFPDAEEMCEFFYGRDVLRWFFVIKPTSQELVKAIKDVNNRVYIMPDLEKHDISLQEQKALLILISTLPGVPMIRAGEEIGVSGTFESGIDWDKGDYKIREFYNKIFKIRNSHPALKYGTISNVRKSGDITYAYVREYGDEKIIVVINFLDKSATSELDLSFVPKGTVLYDGLNDEEFVVGNPSNFRISVPAYGGRILKKEADNYE